MLASSCSVDSNSHRGFQFAPWKQLGSNRDTVWKKSSTIRPNRGRMASKALKSKWNSVGSFVRTTHINEYTPYYFYVIVRQDARGIR
eukprot:scaffold543_cov119-Cylindrotheca_fusiformis.AAC.11